MKTFRVIALLGLTAVVVAPPARAQKAEPAAIITPTAGSATTFSVQLPAGAACGGDSAHDGFRVQSYMVPSTVDPATLTFGSAGPEPTAIGAAFRQPLYTATTAAYVNVQTANADHDGDTGTIVNLPLFSLAVFAPGEMPADSYNVGIACTKGPSSADQLEKFWNAEMSIKGPSIDTPPVVAKATPTNETPSSAGANRAVADTPNAVPAPSLGSSTAAVSSGGPPSMTVPAFQLPSHLPLTGKVGIALWLLIATICARVALLFIPKPLLITEDL